mmetsp:Transcript_19242/g.18579  ORF Transcript_19242/g.18579 Transcript_19242/m.18579 type:complete len:206 (+) Transcript_19242:127-744(+)
MGDLMSGWGVWEEPSGARYEGEFCLGLRQGLGILVYPPTYVLSPLTPEPVSYDDDSDDDSINKIIDKNYVVGVLDNVLEDNGDDSDDEFEYSANETMSVEHILEACRDFNTSRHDTDIDNINLNLSMNMNFHVHNNGHSDSNGSLTNASTSYSSDELDARGISCLDECCTYRGSWLNDLPHGFGIIELRNRQIFMADFYRGVKRS